MYVTAFASISSTAFEIEALLLAHSKHKWSVKWKTLRPGEIPFRIERKVFAREEYECRWRHKILVNWSDTFLRTFQAYSWNFAVNKVGV